MKKQINDVLCLGKVECFNSDTEENLENLKPLFYGLILPVMVLLLTHSLIAIISIQSLLYFIHSKIQKDQKKAKETVKMFVLMNVIYGVLFLPFLLAVK